jgi:hypothetical protein
MTTDVFGNFVPAKPQESILRTNRWFVREGGTSRIASTNRLALALGEFKFDIRDAAAGILVRLDSHRVVLALAQGSITVEAPRLIQATRGRFNRDQWITEGTLIVDRIGNHTLLEVREPSVVQLAY